MLQRPSIVDALNGVTGFSYDPNGNLLTVTDARGNTITHEYDSMDRLNRRIDQLGKAETFAYDGNGNLVSTTDRKLQTTTFVYDPLNRRTQASYADGAIASFTYDAAGRLFQADDTADPHRPISMAYDTLDRLLSESTTLGSVSYAYDTFGRRTAMTVSGQSPVAYTYDANSRLRTITQASLNPVDIQYDATGRRTLLSLPNQVSTEYQYDFGSRLTALIYRNALAQLGDLTYQYDNAGNRIAVGGSWARTLLPDPVPSATYDAANRQLAFGNRTLTFDDNGSLMILSDTPGTKTFTWDTRNRLVALSGATAASFAYDALDRRTRRETSGGLRIYQYDGVNTIREFLNGQEATYLRTLAVDEALTRSDATGTVAFLTDALGSTIALTDDGGAIGTTHTYEPFGRTLAGGPATGNPFQFTGRENDETGLLYYRARYYTPLLARFISEDPLLVPMHLLTGCLGIRLNRTVWVVPGMVNGDLPLIDPTKLTATYLYVANNPLFSGDPTGLDKDRRPDDCAEYSGCMAACLPAGFTSYFIACLRQCTRVPARYKPLCAIACVAIAGIGALNSCDALCNKVRCK
jgi:RHS repeat-associated protein